MRALNDTPCYFVFRVSELIKYRYMLRDTTSTNYNNMNLPPINIKSNIRIFPLTIHPLSPAPFSIYELSMNLL
jgi:hypothetical protein